MQSRKEYAKVSQVINMKKQLRGSLFLLLTTLIWGSAFISQSVGMDHIGPFTFQAVRCLMATIGLIPMIAVADRFLHKNDGKTFLSRWMDPKLLKTGLLCGIPLFLAVNLQQFGLVDTDAGKTAFLTSMYIVIVPIIGLFLKKKTTIMVPISIVLAVIGLYFLSCVGGASFTGSDLMILLCAVMFAVQIVIVDLFAKDIDALRLNAIQSFICAVLSGIGMLFTEQPTWDAIAVCALPLAHAGFLSMGCAYALQILGQKDVEPTTASLIMSLESVFATVLAFLILHETMTQWEVIGCVLVFAAVILSQIPIKSKENASL